MLYYAINIQCTCAHAQGYDMEDAMILNKASVERGLAHASVYKSEVCIIISVQLASTIYR